MTVRERRFNWEYEEGYSKPNLLGSLPLMSEAECKLIESYLKPTYIMFEWGSGGSTLHFPKFVNTLYTIEHLDQWYFLVASKVASDPILKTKVKMACIHSDLPFSYADTNIPRDTFKNYIEAIKLPKREKFDAILVDGEKRVRKYCALESLNYMDKDSVLFLHDYYSEKTAKLNWSELEDYFNVVDKVDTLVVMKKK